MATLELDVNKWAEEQFGECKLGDVRRTERAVRLGAEVAAHPDGSTSDFSGPVAFPRSWV